MEELIKNGFIFGNIEIDDFTHWQVQNLPFDQGKRDAYLKWGYTLTEETPVFNHIKMKLMEQLSDEFAAMLLELNQVEMHYFEKGECMPLHNDVSQNCFAQIVLWVPETDDYAGREFLYGTNEGLKIHKPKLGDFCLSYNMDPKFIHAVNMLKDDTRIYTFTYELMKLK